MSAASMIGTLVAALAVCTLRAQEPTLPDARAELADALELLARGERAASLDALRDLRGRQGPRESGAAIENAYRTAIAGACASLAQGRSLDAERILRRPPPSPQLGARRAVALAGLPAETRSAIEEVHELRAGGRVAESDARLRELVVSVSAEARERPRGAWRETVAAAYRALVAEDPRRAEALLGRISWRAVPPRVAMPTARPDETVSAIRARHNAGDLEGAARALRDLRAADAKQRLGTEPAPPAPESPSPGQSLTEILEIVRELRDAIAPVDPQPPRRWRRELR